MIFSPAELWLYISQTKTIFGRKTTQVKNFNNGLFRLLLYDKLSISEAVAIRKKG